MEKQSKKLKKERKKEASAAFNDNSISIKTQTLN
jgi:hypothetical protein